MTGNHHDITIELNVHFLSMIFGDVHWEVCFSLGRIFFNPLATPNIGVAFLQNYLSGPAAATADFSVPFEHCVSHINFDLTTQNSCNACEMDHVMFKRK